MNDFASLSASIDHDNPPARTLADLRTLLIMTAALAENDLFAKRPVFHSDGDPKLSTNRTTVAQLLHEIEQLSSEQQACLIRSKNLETLIEHISIADTLIQHAPGSGHEHEVRLRVSGMLNALIRKLVELIRDGLHITHQIITTQALDNLSTTAQKVSYLSQLLLTYKQRKDFYDPPFYQKLTTFLKDERKKWQLRLNNDAPHFSNAAELRQYISELIVSVVAHRIHYKDGYKNFWQNEKCTIDKREEDVQQYIEGLLVPGCEAKNIQIQRESSAAGGFVDMTFIYLQWCVCLEIKKSQHQDVTNAMNGQLRAYMQAAKTSSGIYLVLWLKPPPGKEFSALFPTPVALEAYLRQQTIAGADVATHVVDCTKPVSPSKLGSL